jgi:hypothetical protein
MTVLGPIRPTDLRASCEMVMSRQRREQKTMLGAVTEQRPAKTEIYIYRVQ